MSETIDTNRMPVKNHTPQVPHNINGDGKVTLCPPECAAHEYWKVKQHGGSSAL